MKQNRLNFIPIVNAIFHLFSDVYKIYDEKGNLLYSVKRKTYSFIIYDTEKNEVGSVRWASKVKSSPMEIALTLKGETLGNVRSDGTLKHKFICDFNRWELKTTSAGQLEVRDASDEVVGLLYGKKLFTRVVSPCRQDDSLLLCLIDLAIDLIVFG